MLPFFGLTSAHRVHTHELIFDIVMASKGGYSSDGLYNMHLYRRRFVFNKMSEYIKARNAEIEASKTPDSKPLIYGPDGNAYN